VPQITEGALTFHFPDGWQVSKFDQWGFYRNQFVRITGTKAIDILALDGARCCWSIEVKDYSRNRREKAIDLADEIALKVRDTLAALVAAQVNANDFAEKAAARTAVRCPGLRVVLHLEQPARNSKLFPRAIDPANMTAWLKQLVKAIDPHPLVVEKTRMQGVPWTVT
jgi:hypothetical protein